MTLKQVVIAGLFLWLTVPMQAQAEPELATEKASFVRPDSIPFSRRHPYDPQVATLGKMLFFDPRLSGAQNMSCSSCHNPSFGWETPVDVAIGANNTKLDRHAPTLLDRAWAPYFFWDGRSPSLEQQAMEPIVAPLEMNAKFDQLITRLRQVSQYRTWFMKLFPGQGITEGTILRAIATYERTIVSGIAPFDRWVQGEKEAISPAAKRGFALFVGEAGCSTCHASWSFTDHQFHDIGLNTTDLGRYNITPDDIMTQFAFKTAGLRNIALRAPYMHNGSLKSLSEVLDHYSSGGINRPSRSPNIVGFSLDIKKKRDLIAFLETLTEDSNFVPAPVLPAN